MTTTEATDVTTDVTQAPEVRIENASMLSGNSSTCADPDDSDIVYAPWAKWRRDVCHSCRYLCFRIIVSPELFEFGLLSVVTPAVRPNASGNGVMGPIVKDVWPVACCPSRAGVARFVQVRK